nr:reverse transcriptase domain-containing protein [Tanacetum cinerariifolium]
RHFYNGLTLRHRDTINAAAGGTFMKRPTVGQTQNAYAAGAYQGGNSYQPQAPVHQPPIPQPQVVTSNEFTNFMKANDAILKNMQTNMTSLTNSNLKLKNMFGQFMKMNTASSSGSGTLLSNTITNQKEDLKGITTRSGTTYQGPTIPTTSSSLPKVVEHALILMPKFGPSIKTLLTNKDKLFELARTLLNKHCSRVLLKKLPEKLGDPGKFPIPCDFLRMDECLALADLGASINLMSFLVWNKLSLHELSPTCMTLELADRSISHPVGVAEDVFVKVGMFHFLTDFVVVDFDADPRVPLILKRSFLKTKRALIDVFKGELTLRVGKEAITFNLDQTSRYSAKYNDMTVNRIDVIDMACKEYSQEVMGFFDVIAIGNPTTYYDRIVSTSSPTLTPFGDTFLNDDPSLPIPNQGNYLPEVRKELKICRAKTDKSSIAEPLEVELKDLPPHPEYIFLEGDDKFPVIIAKDLSDEEETAVITVLKSHKRAVAWKLSDIKGINPEFCTHKILMKEDFKPTVQHQRRANPKIHDVIKKDVEKLLNAGLIYPIFDSPWVLLLQEFKFKVIDTKGAENLAVDQLSRLENPHQNMLNPKEINESFPLDTLNMVSLHGNVVLTKEQILQRCEALLLGRPLFVQNLCGSSHPKIFDVWGIDFMGPFSSSQGNKYILMAVNYLSKWVEVKALPTNDARVVYKFLKSFFARFGTPRTIISDHEMYFCNDQFAKVMLKKVQLNELNELHDQANENSLIYKEKTKRLHNLKIKDRVSNIGDRVLLFNSRLKIFSGKLKTRWSGPFTIIHVFPYGTVELSQIDGLNFKVNGHRLKHYFGEDILKMVVPDL